MKAKRISKYRGQERYQLSPALVEKILSGEATRILVPKAEDHSPVPSRFWAAERHLFYVGKSRFVCYLPSCETGLRAPSGTEPPGKSPDVEVLDFRPSLAGAPPKTDMKARPPTDLRRWSTRLVCRVTGTRESNLQSLSVGEMVESGVATGVQAHPANGKLYRDGLRALWDSSWGRTRPYEQNPTVRSIRVEVDQEKSRPDASRRRRATVG